MKRATVDARAFADAMNKVSKVLRKSPLPILEEIAVHVENGLCTLTATDLDTWLVAELPARGDDVSFVFSRTKDVMKACAHFEGELALTFVPKDEKEGKIEALCGQRAAEFSVTSHENYPECGIIEGGTSLRVNAAALYRRIERVRYALNGSCVGNEYISSGFLPEHCLHVSMNAEERRFVIWNPDLRADVIYRDTEYLDFPLPRLVFGLRVLADGRVADCSMGVVADEPPTEDTPMFYYPFSNVYEDERVCTGNNILPRYKKLSAMKNFPRYLLGLPDNDDMFNSTHNQKGLDHKALLEHLKDKDPAYYYTDILVPNGRTLSDFILRR